MSLRQPVGPPHATERGDSSRRTASLWAWGGLALFSLLACTLLVRRGETGMGAVRGGVLQRGVGTGASVPAGAAGSQPNLPGRADAGPYQRIEGKNGRICAEYGCRNFNNLPLHASYSISPAELAAYQQGYGFYQSELDALDLWQKNALGDAHSYAVQNRLKQAELDRMGAAIKADYRARCRSLLVARGFAILPGKVLTADIPAVARRNVKELRRFALDLESQAGSGASNSDGVVGAALSLVQTAFLYEQVPALINGRQTGGIYPPLEAIARGKGDCDTKSALLAAILMNWGGLKLIGVGAPEHYLMGVLRNPAKGDAFVEYRGERYVLMEPAGPAWLPLGAVGPATAALLESGEPLTIEPFTLN